MGCQSLTEIDMNKEYKYLSTKMKIRAYKKQGKKIYTKWNNYLDARSVYGSNFNLPMIDRKFANAPPVSPCPQNPRYA